MWNYQQKTNINLPQQANQNTICKKNVWISGKYEYLLTCIYTMLYLVYNYIKYFSVCFWNLHFTGSPKFHLTCIFNDWECKEFPVVLNLCFNAVYSLVLLHTGSFLPSLDVWSLTSVNYFSSLIDSRTDNFHTLCCCQF